MDSRIVNRIKPTTDTTERQPRRLFVLLALIGMMAFGAGLGWYVFSRTSLRLDEAQSLFQTSRDIPGLLRLIAQDVHVPFYHVLLHLWLKVFGSDIVTARLFSLMFFVLTIPLVYMLGRYAFNRRVGLYAALLLTITPFMNWYASETRMYAMLVFITVLHQLFFIKIFREGKPAHWWGYTLTAVAGVYTHYFFAFVLLTEALFFLIYRKHFPAKTLRKLFASAVLVGASIAPWLYYVYNLGVASNTRPSLETPSSGDLFNTYAQFIFGFQIDYLNTVIVSLWPVIVLLAFFSLQKNRETQPPVIYFVMAAVLPVAMAFLISITLQPFYLSRYLIVSIPALFIFLSWTLSGYQRKLQLSLKLLLVAAVAVTLVIQTVSPNTPVKENYAEAVSYLNQKASPQDIIIASAPFTIYPIEYYYEGRARIATQPRWDRFQEGAIPAFDAAKLPQETKELTRSYQRVWLILSYDQGYNNAILKHYDANYARIDTQTFSPNLSVYAYKLRYDDPVKVTPLPPELQSQN